MIRFFRRQAWKLFFASLLIGGGTAVANYVVLDGTGASQTFGSAFLSGVHYAEHAICDFVTAGRCMTVTASNEALVNVNNANSNGTATAANSSPVVLASDSVDVCFRNAKTNAAISFQGTSLTQQIAASGSNKIYICSMSLVASAATVFSVVGGTGSNCASNQLAILGTLASSHGLALAANGIFTLGSGLGTVAVTAASSEICLVQSAGDLVGNMTYVYAP